MYFNSIFCLFLLGFKCKQITDSVVQMVTAYDSFHSGTWEDLGCGISQANEGKTCTITFTPDTDMEPPVLIYYEINNFYQNHRSYMTSRDDNQVSFKDALLLGLSEKVICFL
jgi:hypothetical protein